LNGREKREHEHLRWYGNAFFRMLPIRPFPFKGKVGMGMGQTVTASNLFITL